MINYHVHSDQIINSSFFKISSNKSQKSIFNKQILLNNYFSERDCKCNFKGPSMQRLPCLIYNGTLEIWSVHINVIFPTQKCLFLWVSPLLLVSKKCASHFRRETANKNIDIIIHTWSVKSIVNQELSFLYLRTLEITLQVDFFTFSYSTIKLCQSMRNKKNDFNYR